MRVAMLLVPLALAACAAQPTVNVQLRYLQPGVLTRTATFAEQGARAWEPAFGVGQEPYEATSATPECAERWFETTEPACRIVIGITFVPASELGGALGTTVRSSRSTAIAFELHDFEIESVVAHEVGHTVFDTDDHLAPGLVGIMSARTTWDLVPTEADLAFANDHMNRGVM